MAQLVKQPKVKHSPTLETVLMVEQTIKDAKQVLSVADIKRIAAKG